MTEPIIKWQKFFAPTDKSNDYDKDDYEEPYKDFYDDKSPIILMPSEQMSEDEYIASEFNVWTMYTNFDITEEIEAIAGIEGVEHVGFISRYRLKIAFAPLFEVGETAKRIKLYLLGPNSSNLPITDDVKEIIEEAKQFCTHYSDWALFMFPNGRIITSVFNGENGDIHQKRIEMFKESRAKVGGILLTSKDNESYS